MCEVALRIQTTRLCFKLGEFHRLLVSGRPIVASHFLMTFGKCLGTLKGAGQEVEFVWRAEEIQYLVGEHQVIKNLRSEWRPIGIAVLENLTDQSLEP